MNIQFTNGFNNQIQKTYFLGKYAKSLYESFPESSNIISPKNRNGIVISISDKAKESFAKAQQIKYSHNYPVASKNTSTKAIFEKVNSSDNTQSKANSQKKKKTNSINLSDIYDNLSMDIEKSGFVVSGNLFTEETKTEKTAAEKLLEIFELDKEKALGSLVNVVV